MFGMVDIAESERATWVYGQNARPLDSSEPEGKGISA
jgi:hypothetical protein